MLIPHFKLGALNADIQPQKNTRDFHVEADVAFRSVVLQISFALHRFSAFKIRFEAKIRAR
jgi:hypothetical protein